MSATGDLYHQICNLCSAACGLEVRCAGRSVLDVRGFSGDRLSSGHVCAKGVALRDLDSDPDRLRTPMLRHGRQWRSASWREAFDAIQRGLGAALERNGRSSLGVYIGNPAVHNLSVRIFGPALLAALGAPNLFTSSTLDQMPKEVACAWMFGRPNCVPIPDLDRCSYLLCLGANPIVSNGSLMTAPPVGERLRRLQARGGRVVVIDPVRTRTAQLADEHCFIRPGTDAWFLLGLIHVLFAEERVDPGRLRAHCTGIEEMRRLVEPFTPDVVSRRCAMPAELVIRLARELARARGAAIHTRMGTCAQQFGTLSNWLPEVIHVLTGNLDRPGGAMFPLPAFRPLGAGDDPGPFRIGRRATRVRGAPEVRGEFPAVCLAEEMDTAGPGQIRSLLCIAGNPVLSTPNGARLAQALESLEFMVSIDLYLNETSRYAHVLLPGDTPFETGHYAFSGWTAIHNFARYTPAPFAVSAGHHPEWQTLLRLAGLLAGGDASAELDGIEDRLAARLVTAEVARPSSAIHGRPVDEILGELEPRRGPERLLDLILRVGPYGDGFGANRDGLTLAALGRCPEGIDLGPLQPRITELLRTASGMIELTPAPLVVELERLRAVPEPRDALRLVGRRHERSNNSWMHNLEKLVSGRPRCTLLLHPRDARTAGLADGDAARVSSSFGSLVIPVEVTGEIMPGVVSIPHGWGHGAPSTQLSVANAHAGVNCNLLLSEQICDEPSGTAVFFGVEVAVEPAAEGAAHGPGTAPTSPKEEHA